MSDDIIGMKEMGAVFSVTDYFGIHRESVSVPLEKEDPGAVRVLPDGEIEIVVPQSVPVEEWLETLKANLEHLGFTATEEENGEFG